MLRRLLTASVATMVLSSSTEIKAAGHAVTFRSDDGRTINGTLVEANRRPAPGVVLVPMLGRSRDDWQTVAEHLADANITALTIDLPGGRAPGDPRDLAAWHTVVGGSLSYLVSAGNVRASSLGVAGASLGASLAALAAAADGRIRALALVSPSLEYRGVSIEAALQKYGGRPALLIASLHDPYAARTVRQLSTESAGPREVQWTETPAHGTILLSREPDLGRAVAEWFRRVLPVN